MKRLIEQTACEHGEYGLNCMAFVCDHIKPHLGTPLRTCRCPGGSSREVTVDVEAGAEAGYTTFWEGKVKPWDLAEDEPHKNMMREVAQSVVDAALKEST